MSPSPRAALLCLLLLGLVACAGKRDRAPGRDARFTLGALGDGWRPMDPLGADRSWYHPGLSATIYADASCADRYEDGELEALLKHLTFGIAKGAPLSSEALQLDGRDALVQRWDGALDGVGVKVGAMVTKKNDCLYDVLYVAPPARFDEGWGDFVAAVQGFRVGR
ncbi:MAG: hypothetical protein JNM72_27275 [Deltaproteobacteria bacterium]|nr:hypothetical protein [Deltaproteobacteria bacterium]